MEDSIIHITHSGYIEAYEQYAEIDGKVYSSDSFKYMRNPIAPELVEMRYHYSLLHNEEKSIIRLTAPAEYDGKPVIRFELPIIETISNEMLLKLIDKSVEVGKTEITAALMQKLHKRKYRG